ncbi:hypothetical protein [Pseudomonas sp. R1-15]|uniref:hypothetical protein n=1 Tax=Pseudomonas sp. R1-15 TaxID=2817399 RepID=UPI003DA83D38
MHYNHINRIQTVSEPSSLTARYLLENIEVFYAPMHSMGAIMYSFAQADNPLISKKIYLMARPKRLFDGVAQRAGPLSPAHRETIDLNGTTSFTLGSFVMSSLNQ